MSIQNIQDKAFISFLYLTGARIGEVVRRFNVGNILIQKEQGQIIYIFRIYIEKKRTSSQGYRNVPIPYESYKEYIEAIKDYILVARIKDDMTLFPFSRVTGWKKCENWLGFNPHWLRHTRITHLVQEYGFTDQQLVAWTGWKDSRPASTYTHLNWKNLVQNLL